MGGSQPLTGLLLGKFTNFPSSPLGDSIFSLHFCAVTKSPILPDISTAALDRKSLQLSTEMLP